MIPKIIWQTYETSFDDLIDDAKQCSQTWITKNPFWEYRYMSAEERKNFVLDKFGQEWLEIYNSCEKNIVRSNIWRFMVLYIYGGMYCDLDTVCNIPIDQWINDRYSLILCIDDNKTDYAIFAFLSAPGHPALKEVLDQIKINLSNNPKLDNDSVIELTGEAVWTNAVNNNLENVHIFEDHTVFESKLLRHFGSFKTWHNSGYLQWNKKK